MKVKGRSLLFWKSEIIIEKPLKQVFENFPRLFHNHRCNFKIFSDSTWYHVRDTSSPETETEYILHLVSNMPPVFQTRDICVHATFHSLDETRALFIYEQSKTIPVSAEVIRVRTKLSGSYFKALSPTSTQVTSIVDADQGGLIPKWFLNIFGSDLSKNTTKFKAILESGLNLEAFVPLYKPLKQALHEKK